MRRSRRQVPRVFAATVCLLFAVIVAPAGAAPITYTVQQINGDHWQYQYFVDNRTWAAFEGFAIDFDQSLYGPFMAVTASADWDVLIFDPVPNDDPNVLPAPGLFDALALVDNIDTSSPLLVDVQWLGPGTPGSQPYRIYFSGTPPDFLDFAEIDSGMTQLRNNPIPEPGTLLLLGSGLAAALRGRRRRSRATNT